MPYRHLSAGSQKNRWFLGVLLVILFSFVPVPGSAGSPGRTVASFDCTTVVQIPLADCEALVAIYNSTGGAGWTQKTGWLTTTTPCTTPWFGVACLAGVVDDLDLSSNNLAGTVPIEIGDFTGIKGISLQDNALTGAIPDEIGNLTGLDFLSFSTNQLSGSLPASIGNLTVLSNLWLDNNQFTGSIPTSFGNFTNISTLYLFDNQLSGTIPSQLGNLTTLWDLELQNNRLSGTIPSQLGNLTSLFFLLLQNNALEGDIPASLSSLTFIFAADFGYNKLTASDAGVIAWLATADSNWSHTQTVAPTSLAAGAVTASSVQLGWTPITYIGDGGYYEVYISTAIGGPYSLHGTTANKSANSYTAGGLSGGTTHYFCIRTFTPVHGSQQNNLWSSLAGPVNGTTSAPSGGCLLAAPFAIGDLSITTSGVDAILDWSAIATDVNGTPITVSAYHVYRDTDPDIDLTDPISSTNSLTFTDTGAVDGVSTFFYAVLVEDTRQNTSLISNRVGVFPFSLAPGGAESPSLPRSIGRD